MKFWKKIKFKRRRSLDRELKRQILKTTDELDITTPTKIVVRDGKTIEVDDPEYKILSERQQRLFALEIMRRKEQNVKWQIACMAGVPLLLITTGWGARVLVQTPYWKDWVRFIEKLANFKFR